MNSKRQTLSKLMSLVDEYKDTMKEGDYLQLCNLLRDLWKENGLPDFDALRRLRVKRYYEMYDKMRMLQKYRVSADFNPSDTLQTDKAIVRLGTALIKLQPYISTPTI